MDSSSNSFRRAALCSLLAVGLSSACIFSPEDGPYLTPEPTPLDRSTRDNTLRYYELVWRHKLYTQYEEVLHGAYEFFPRSEDADDFPWLEEDSWPRTVELGMAENMFDPNFEGGEQPVDTIELELEKLNEVLIDAGEQRYEVTCRQFGSVMFSATDGKSFDTRISLELVPDPQMAGLWQIVKQTELSPT
jgi:hypothetical protein